MHKEALARKLSGKKITEFWKEVSSTNNCKTPLPGNIDQADGPNEIVELWRKHFKDVFNCLKNNDKSSIHYNLDVPSSNITVNACMVNDAIKELDPNKSCGLDGISAEH